MGDGMGGFRDMDPKAQAMIDALPWQYRRKALDGWWMEFEYWWDLEEVPYRKYNKGRFHANTRLRKFCEKVNKKGV